jgi:glc operon protein GlcG
MRNGMITTAVLAAALSTAVAAHAQQPAAPAPAAPAAPAPAAAVAPVPQYGTPGVNLAEAKKAIAAAAAEAQKNGWPVAIAVTSNGGHLVAFERLDGTQFASIKIAEHKARAAAMFRRPTKVFEDRVASGGAGLAVLSLDGVIASDGGIPLTRADGKIIGGIGVSGVLGSQDAVAAKAGADALK